MFLKNLKELSIQISDSCKRHNRSPLEISLIGVSKTKPLDDITKAYDAGLRQFGENFVEEFVDYKEKQILWCYRQARSWVPDDSLDEYDAL